MDNGTYVIQNLTITQPSGDFYLNLFSTMIFPIIVLLILLLASRREIFRDYFRIRTLMKTLFRKTGMGIIMIATDIDMKTVHKFDIALDTASRKGIKEIILILHTFGGFEFAMSRIVKSIRNFDGKIHCYIPKYAMSAGTFIAMSGASIHMAEISSLGAVDPQIGILFWVHSSKAWQEIVKKKGVKANDESIAMAMYATQYNKLMRNQLDQLPILKGLSRLKTFLTDGNIPHAMQLDHHILKGYGLKVQPIEYPEVSQLVLKNPIGFKFYYGKKTDK